MYLVRQVQPPRSGPWGPRLLVGLVAVAAVLPVLRRRVVAPWAAPPATHAGKPPPGFPGWPTHLGGEALTKVQLTPLAAGLAARVPGVVGCFRSRTRLVHILWLTAPTRALHSRDGCALASGYEVRPLADWVDPQGGRWGAMVATRDGESLLVRERIYNQAGDSFSSVYAWYLTAFTGASRGPWWVVMTQETVRPR